MRDAELIKQRSIAEQREAYLQDYFVKVKMHFSGNLILLARDFILSFLMQFDPSKDVQHRTHRLVSAFSPATGLTLSPTRETFKAWIVQTVQNIRDSFVSEEKEIKTDVIIDIFPDFSFEFSRPADVLARCHELAENQEAVLEALDDAFNFFEEDLRPHRHFLSSLMTADDNAREISDLRNMEDLESTITYLVRNKEEFMNRPKSIFHKVHRAGETRADFVADMRPAWDSGSKLLEQAMCSLRDRTLNELNNSLFLEIQEKWTQEKDGKLTKLDCTTMESRMLMYSIMAVAVTRAWPETISDCKAGLDTVMRMYQALAEKSRFTHKDACRHFNDAVELFGIRTVQLQPEEEDEEEDYEYEYGNEEGGEK
jgi:hypothetical protein